MNTPITPPNCRRNLARWGQLTWIVLVPFFFLSGLSLLLSPVRTVLALAQPEVIAENRGQPALQVTTTPVATITETARVTPSLELDETDIASEPLTITTETVTIAPQAAITPTYSFSFANLNESDLVLTSPAGSAQVSFRLPVNWLIESDGLLTLDTSFEFNQYGSADEPPIFANLTVLLNGNVLDTIVIDERVFNHRQFNLRLPQASFSNLERSITVGLILNAGFLCETPHQATLTVHPTSTILLNHREGPLLTDVSRFPQPFYQQVFFKRDQVTLILPARPSQPDLAGAARLVAAFGQLTNNQVVISSTTDIDFAQSLADNTATANQEHLIIVGQPHENELIPLLDELTELPVTLHRRQVELTSQGPLTIGPAETLTYDFTLKNTVDQPLALTIVDQLPPLLELVECSASCLTNPDGRTIVWEDVALPPNDSLELSLTLQSGPQLTAGLPLANTITVIDAALGPLNADTITANSNQAATNQARQVSTAETAGYFFVQNGQAVVKDDGLIQEIVSPWNPNRAILMITGLNETALDKASLAMSFQPRLLKMEGPVALIEEVVLPEEINALTEQGYATLATLGYDDQIVQGQPNQRLTYQFEIPPDWQLTDGAYLDFFFAHSQIIDYATSNFNVLINNRPAVSIPLNDKTAEAGYLRVNLSEARILPGQPNTIDIQIQLGAIDACTSAQSSQAWFILSNRSQLYLPHTQAAHPPLDFAQFPFPFNTSRTLVDLLFVLPDDPSRQEIDIALALIASFGRFATGRALSPQLLMASQLPEDLSSYHMITIGRPTRNSLLQQINNALPQPFRPGLDEIEQRINNIVFRLPAQLDVGYIQLLPAPWAPAKTILAITGTSDSGVKAATQALLVRSKSLAGNLVLVKDERVTAVDTRLFTPRGVAMAVATAIATTLPEVEPIRSTVTPTAPPLAANPTPDLPDEDEGTSAGLASFPGWLLPLVGLNGLIVGAIFAFVAWRAFKGKA